MKIMSMFLPRNLCENYVDVSPKKLCVRQQKVLCERMQSFSGRNIFMIHPLWEHLHLSGEVQIKAVFQEIFKKRFIYFFNKNEYPPGVDPLDSGDLLQRLNAFVISQFFFLVCMLPIMLPVTLIYIWCTGPTERSL